MSVDYSAIAVLGVRVDKKSLFVSRDVRSCSHAIPDGAVFCPACGLKVWKKVKGSVIQGIEEYGFIDPWIEDIRVAWDTNKEYYYFGLSNIVGEYGKPAVTYLPDNISEIRGKLERLLTSYGLWDPTSFGLHAVLYCSY